MIEATMTMLRARREERIHAAGVIAALFCDDVAEAVQRLENARDAARECARAVPRKEPAKRAIYEGVAAWADDMIGPVRQLAERAS